MRAVGRSTAVDRLRPNTADTAAVFATHRPQSGMGPLALLPSSIRGMGLVGATWWWG